MTFEPEPFAPSDLQAIDAQASILMKRGIRLLSDPQPDALAEALRCFDGALELRRGLPIETDPALKYGLAACWLNRADALLRSQGATPIAEALHAYDEAIVLLRSLPLADDSRFPRRLAIAHQNRGLALHAQGGSAITAAFAAFTDAIAVLDHEQSSRIADREYLLAAVWINLANAYASKATAESDALARDAALRAMALVGQSERNDADAAEVGLKARHVLCQAMARHLSLDAEALADDVHTATDLVDEGLDLVRQWEHKGTTRFRDVACDLFRFGARVYIRYQPQFLNEFVLEHVDPIRSSRDYVESAAIRAAAQEALALQI